MLNDEDKDWIRDKLLLTNALIFWGLCLMSFIATFTIEIMFVIPTIMFMYFAVKLNKGTTGTLTKL